MDDLSQFVPKVYFDQIRIKDLVSNQDYQRNISISNVKRAADNFDLYQINPVKVSRRDGINYVFNGQHTIEIVALVSGSRETPVWCMIYDDLEYTQEADIFANQLKYTKALTPYEIFNANIEAGNDTQLMIRDLVQSFGLKIAHTKTPGAICAISTLESILSKYGFHVLNRTLTLCCGTWEGDYNSFSGNILMGIARLIVAYEDTLKDEIFKEKLGCVSTRELIRSAKERNNGSMGYAEAMLSFYNRRMKPGLPWGKLYSAKSKGKKYTIPPAMAGQAGMFEATYDDTFDEEPFDDTDGSGY